MGTQTQTQTEVQRGVICPDGKNAQPISMKMDKATFGRFEAYGDAGQPKTVAIERALNKLRDEYDDMAEAYESRKAGRRV